MKLRNEVMRLHNKGWSLIRIHEHLLENGYDIGKNVNTVSQLMRRINKRRGNSSQPIIDGIGGLLSNNCM